MKKEDLTPALNKALGMAASKKTLVKIGDYIGDKMADHRLIATSQIAVVGSDFVTVILRFMNADDDFEPESYNFDIDRIMDQGYVKSTLLMPVMIEIQPDGYRTIDYDILANVVIDNIDSEFNKFQSLAREKKRFQNIYDNVVGLEEEFALALCPKCGSPVFGGLNDHVSTCPVCSEKLHITEEDGAKVLQ